MSDASDTLRRRLGELIGLPLSEGGYAPAEVNADQLILRLLVRNALGGEERVWEIRAEGASLGRGLGNDIVLAHEEVSSLHALVHLDGGTFFVTDRSRNGTFMGAESAPSRLVPGKAYPIGDGDRVLIADFIIVCEVAVAQKTDDGGGVSLLNESSAASSETLGRSRFDDMQDPFEAIRRLRETRR